ncbi:NAD-dependent epimerase/dehydratase family protein [Mesohalobacter halotolerans]|uniref:NAD-dependent epimerase/dehydratase family protein n=1 Tax=Mesohalobacter halotolerans TaxID=1883405 RepID=A0A4U5TUK2_9FLAO|nr:NAD-dependent epimerase/dehydratase family protein [Mesohalobacter halotolerans]TKS56978.1 NAD-dependent epimerase/dehydratase family protein [Mesohalobacter halotolerans]
MNILITGSTGFVGKNLTNRLDPSKYKFSILNLRDEQWPNQIQQNTNDAYIHLAGIAHDLSNKNDDNIYYEVNFELTKDIYNCFLKDEKAKTFIFFSSIKALADQPEQILTEGLPPQPKTVYGKSKLLAENYILDNLPSNKTVIILRPCMIHGPENKGNLNLLLKAVSYHIPWIFGRFENKRSYCSIDNLCFVVDRILNTPSMKSGLYHIADDTSISTNKLISIIANALGKRSIQLNVPKLILLTLTKFGDRLKLPINSQVLNKITGTYEVSNLKIKQELGIKKLPLSTEEGLRKTVQHYKHD